MKFRLKILLGGHGSEDFNFKFYIFTIYIMRSVNVWKLFVKNAGELGKVPTMCIFSGRLLMSIRITVLASEALLCIEYYEKLWYAFR